MFVPILIEVFNLVLSEICLGVNLQGFGDTLKNDKHDGRKIDDYRIITLVNPGLKIWAKILTTRLLVSEQICAVKG